MPNFEKTLILGASVSAAATARNPAQLYLRSRGWLASSQMHALGGRPSTTILPQLRTSRLDQVSSVIAVDLFFWDSVIGLGDPRKATAFMRGLFNTLRAKNLPIILGRIPKFHDLQIHRDELNAAIEDEVAKHSLARILPLDRLFEQAMSNDGVLIDGRHHRLADLIPDGLHPGPVAAEFIAKELAVVADTLRDSVGAEP